LLSNWTFLNSAIGSYLQALILPHAAGFLLLNTALESMKESYLLALSERELVDESVFKQLTDAIKKDIKFTLPDAIADAPRIRASMYGKLRELNRPPYQQVVREMCKAWDVKLDDLYPEAEKLSFTSVRDAIVHTGHAPNADLLYSESCKLRALVERVIVASLDLPGDPDPDVPLWMP